MKKIYHRLTVPTALLGVVALVSNCDCAAKPPPPAGGELCGSGQIDGTDYAVQAEGSELVIAVKRVDAFGCGALHSHVVLAPQATFTYDLDSAGKGDVKIIVAAANLTPDDPALRLKFLPEGENQELSEGDRQTIAGSVAEEVKASEFSTLEFTFKGLSTIDGDGTATLESKIAGATSEVPVTYTATKDGDKVTVTGTATIDGEPHGIPRNALGFCVQKDMDLHFSVVLVAGTTVCNGEVDEVPVFVEQTFDDDACGDVGFNVVYNKVLGPRCAGCHGGTFPGNPELLRGGATVPLQTWADFRKDSVRNQNVPLYLTALDYVNLPTDDPGILTMPPGAIRDFDGLPDATQLRGLVGGPITIAGVAYATEKELLVAWATLGEGRELQCGADAADDAIKTFGTRVTPNCSAASIHYGEEGTAGQDARDFFEASCMSCHSSDSPNTAPSAPPVGTGDLGATEIVIDHLLAAAPVTHPFYADDAGAPLSFWEASVHRVEDLSMFPTTVEGALGVDDPGFVDFKTWVLGGYCE